MVVWPTLEDWAEQWFAEWRGSTSGPASGFLHAACDDAVPGVVDALIVLAETADGDAELLGWVGAGPIEDLVSHTGNGLCALADVDRAARQSPAFRAALRNTWVPGDVPDEVRARLVELGAQPIA